LAGEEGDKAVAYLCLNPQVLTTQLEDGAVLLDMDRGIYYSLNPVGLEIWRRMDAPRRLEELATELTGLFEVGRQAANDCVAQFVGELDHEGLLMRCDAPGIPRVGGPGPDGAPRRRRRFEAPALIKHEEPLYEATSSPFDPQLPLAE
jgi:hypothetical protein